MPKVQCSQCNNFIHRYPYQIKKGSHFFCSNKCHTAHKHSNNNFKYKFWVQVNRLSDGCWLWTGIKNQL